MAGENYAKGEIYSKLAARKAQKAGSMPEAIDQTKKRVACLEKFPLTDESQKKKIDSRTVLALYLAQLNHFIEAKEAMDPIIDLAEKLGYMRRLCQIKTILGTYYLFIEENFTASFQAFKEALGIAEEVKDFVSLTLASYWFGINLAGNCEFKEAVRYMQKALDMNVAGGYLSGIASCKAHMAYFCYFCSGVIDLGFKLSAEAVRIAEESGDIFSKGSAYICHGVSCFGMGLFEESEEHLLRGIGFCERVNEKPWNALAHFFLGEASFEKGNFIGAEDCYRKGCLLLRESQSSPSIEGLSKLGMIRSNSMICPKKLDLESLYSHSNNNKIKAIQGLISCCIGDILMNLDDGHLPEAQTWIQKAIEEDRRNGTRFCLGRDYALYAEWFKRNGDRFKARENLGMAVKILKACGADGWVEKYEKELTALQ
jgi:tetratricopeptide (TPR) repeat protein